MTYNVELVELTKASFKSRDPASERSSDLIGPTQPAIADKQEEQVRDDLPKNVFFQAMPELPLRYRPRIHNSGNLCNFCEENN